MEEEMKIPFWNRYLLTINEASLYFNIGRHHLRRIVNDHPDNDFTLYDGTRVLIKRAAFEHFIDETNRSENTRHGQISISKKQVKQG